MSDQELLNWLSRNPEARRVLECLFEACNEAETMRGNAWPQAVEFPIILATGCTNSQLRMLVWTGWVNHAEELTRRSDPVRTFGPEPRMIFGPRSCFVLTKTGVAVIESWNGCTTG